MNIAAIFAGGIGARMTSSALPKQFLEIHGKPIIVHTLEHFENHDEIDGIVVAIVADWRSTFERLVRRYELTKVRWIVDGGATGQESRLKALEAVAADVPEDTIVLLHDGVRPLIDGCLITANISAARQYGAAVTCTRMTETVVSAEAEEVDHVVPRDHLFTAQAPQTFHLGEIPDLYRRAVASGVEAVDSVSLMRLFDRPVRRIEGPRSNIKITTAEDFYVCRTFFDLVESQQISGGTR